MKDTTMLPELLPCPFCGCKNVGIANERHDHSGGYYVGCPECEASTGLRYACGEDPRPLLVEAWNRRALASIRAAGEQEVVAWACPSADGSSFPPSVEWGPQNPWKEEAKPFPLYAIPPSHHPTQEPVEALKKQDSEVRSDIVPGKMRCAKCDFSVIRTVLNVATGNAYAGDNKTEPCPNGCGPLWPVTWEQEAREGYKLFNQLFERARAAEEKLAAATAHQQVLNAASPSQSPELSDEEIIAKLMEGIDCWMEIEPEDRDDILTTVRSLLSSRSKDAERLDFLIAEECQVWEVNGRYSVRRVTEAEAVTAEFPTARAAIDSAIAAQGKGGAE